MAEPFTREYPVRKWGAKYPISDHADAEELREHCVALTLGGARANGWQPVADAEAQLLTAVIPQYSEDPETGEQIKLPDRAWAVSVRVVSAEAGLPDNFRVDAGIATVALPL